MKFINIVQALWCEPWLIEPEMHRQLCAIAEAHISGEAHEPGGIAQAYETIRTLDDPIYGSRHSDDEEKKAQEIAVISVHGVVGKRVGWLAKSSGALDVDDVERAITESVANDNVKGILLHVDSPGGTTTGVPEIAQLIADSSEEKPIVAFCDRLMASAAYWMSAGCEAIYAAPSAQVGSIGVYMAWLDSSRAFEMNGFKAELVKRGKFKAMGLQGTSITDEQRAYLEDRVQSVYEWFTSFVTEHRTGVPADAMEGQTMYAAEARDSGLIDKVGSMEDALEELHDIIEAREDDDNNAP